MFVAPAHFSGADVAGVLRRILLSAYFGDAPEINGVAE